MHLESLSFKKNCNIQWRRMKLGTIRMPGIDLNTNRLNLHVSNGYRNDSKRAIYTES